MLLEARKYYPNIQVRPVYKFGKQSWSDRSVLARHLVIEKIKTIEKWVRVQPGVSRVRHSRTSCSFYFCINEIEFRISDHPANGYFFSGISFKVSYHTDPVEIVFSISSELFNNFNK